VGEDERLPLGDIYGDPDNDNNINNINNNNNNNNLLNPRLKGLWALRVQKNTFKKGVYHPVSFVFSDLIRLTTLRMLRGK
jgi:hypothetical protein